MLTPLALIDLVAILPFYLAFLLPVDLRFMRVFRLVLIFKLTRYQVSMSLLARVLRNEAGPIAAAVFVLAMLLMVAASFAWLAEHEAQPEAFASILDALWWAVVTMTTVGYGDMVPVTPLGRLIGGLIAVIGLGMVALPAGLLASGFSEQLHHRRREFEGEIERVLATAAISAAEGDRLKELRDRLGLTDHQAAEMMRLILLSPRPRPLPALRQAADAGARAGLTGARPRASAGGHDAESTPRRRPRALAASPPGSAGHAALKRTSATCSIARASAGSTSSSLRSHSSACSSARCSRRSTATTSQASA